MDDGDLIPEEYLQLWYTTEESLKKKKKMSNSQVCSQESSKVENLTEKEEDERESNVECKNKYSIRQALFDIKEILNKLS